MKIYDKEKRYDDQGKSNYINNIKMILIFLVVIGHMLTGVRTGDVIARTIYNSIYLFHMPAFIMVTGYLSRGAIKTTDKMKKSVLNYVVLYLYAQVVYDVIQRLALPAGKTFEFTVLTPRYALWYMFLLIFWVPITYILKQYNRWVVVIGSIVLACLVGVFDRVGTDYSLSRFFVFFPFFLIGYYFDIDNIKKIKYKYLTQISILIVILNVLIQYLGRRKIYATWFTGSLSYLNMEQNMIEGFRIRLIYMVCAIIVSFALFRIVPSGEFKITYIGARTLQIYLIHAIICRVFYIRGTLVVLKTATSIWVIIILGILLTILLSNRKFSVVVEWPMKLLYNIKYGKIEKK